MINIFLLYEYEISLVLFFPFMLNILNVQLLICY